ncbi:hypothetical protein BEP19_09465 [Ammoniphilus oxalaticus]|uniref:Uncharacterized protein n=1 Tax=Ammoniphilus oxalaticus TaxID=66863 RepID=A0A419SKT3_9BACL|nr:hypothetical protein [Ammoniphilus oxalaticus]RKD24595.1 hypothetical protein BEP19_09465 [Ammoniphilus oxalaticus]
MLRKGFCRPLNDQCSRATVFQTIPFSANSFTCGAKNHTVWYTFISEYTGTLAVSTAHTDYATKVCIYTGACHALTNVSCGKSDETPVFFEAVAGETYTVSVAGYGRNACGMLYLAVFPVIDSGVL